MGTLANILTMLLVVVDISMNTFGMGMLLVIPLGVTAYTLSREKSYISCANGAVTLGYVYKGFICTQNPISAEQLVYVNQMTVITMMCAFIILQMVASALIIIKQCKIEGPNEVLERKYQIVDSASLTTLYMWFLIMCIYLGCNGFFKNEVLCATSCLTIGLLCVAFVSLKSTLRKAVNDEKAKRLEQTTNRTEVSSGIAN